MYNGRVIKTTTQEKTMTHKIVELAITALIQLTHTKGNSGEFHRDLDDAIKSLRIVKKYL